MQPPIWWLLQGVSLAALLSCTLLAFSASGRVGRQTPYGGFLFVITLGFWFLFTGLAAYVGTHAVGAWNGPPGWGDIFTLPGWAILVASFYLLLLRFPPTGSPRAGRTRLIALPLVGGTAFGALAWLRAAGTGWPDLEGAVRIAYLFLDGASMAVFALSAGILLRLRRATLAQLFAILAAALVLKTLADVLFLVWPDGSPLGVLTTALYPLAGLIAVAGLAMHHHAVGPLRERRVLAHPSFVEPQLVLRDAAQRMRGLAGALGERTVLRAAERTLAEAGVDAHVQEGAVFALAPANLWSDAVAAARSRAIALFGRPAEAIFDDVHLMYGGGPSGGAAS